VILSREEVGRFLEAVGNLKHRTLLMTCYAAGLRISEATHLKVTDVDSQRMVLRVEQGKGQKDRYVMLSPQLLELLRTWWRTARPTTWLFPGERPEQPLSKDAVEQACQRARRRSRISKPISPHAETCPCGTSAGNRHRRPHHSAAARPSQSGTTARYLRIATIKVCATTSLLDCLPRPLTPTVLERQ